MTEIGELVTPTGVLVMTAEAMRGGREEWLAARRWRESVPGGYCIGSSEVPSILDLESVDTPAHVYRAKVMNIRREANEFMTWGHLLEAPIASEWCRRNRAVIDEIGLVAHVKHPHHQSTIDRRVRECPVYDGVDRACGLEVKNVGIASASRWHAEIPDRILAQILHQLYVTGLEHMHYAVLVGGNTMRQGVVHADQEKELTDYIIAEVERFRTENLIARVEPAWNITDKPLRMIELDKATHPDRDGIAELGINGIDAVHVYAQAAADASAAKKRQDAAKAELMRLADGAEYVKFCDELAYRFGPTTKTKVNLDRLAERYPNAYADPEVVSETKSHTIYLAAPYKVKPNREGGA